MTKLSVKKPSASRKTNSIPRKVAIKSTKEKKITKKIKKSTRAEKEGWSISKTEFNNSKNKSFLSEEMNTIAETVMKDH